MEPFIPVVLVLLVLALDLAALRWGYDSRDTGPRLQRH